MNKNYARAAIGLLGLQTVALLGFGIHYFQNLDDGPADPTIRTEAAQITDATVPFFAGDSFMPRPDGGFPMEAFDIECAKCGPGRISLPLTYEEILQAADDAQMAVMDILYPVEPPAEIVVNGEMISGPVPPTFIPAYPVASLQPPSYGGWTPIGGGGAPGGGGFIIIPGNGGGNPSPLAPQPPAPPISAIPEASTWAMLLLGFGFVGAAMRRQTRKVAA